MKKLISIITLCVVVLTLFTGCADELSFLTQSSSKSAENKYKIENGEAILTQAPDLSTLTEITVPDEYEGCPVTKIDDFAIVNLENVQTIYIGKNVREIGQWAMENNQKLTAFVVSEENEHFCDIDGVLYTKDMKTLLFYPLSKGLEKTTVKDENGEEKEVSVMEYTIAEGTETIRTKAFYKCGSITSITIPDSVTRIEEKAFFRCSSVKEFILPEAIEYIGKDAFAYCSSLSYMSIPESIKEIGDYAFYNCTGLSKIDFAGSSEGVVFGKKWEPTNNGREIEVEINYSK